MRVFDNFYSHVTASDVRAACRHIAQKCAGDYARIDRVARDTRGDARFRVWSRARLVMTCALGDDISGMLLTDDRHSCDRSCDEWWQKVSMSPR